MKRPTRKSRHSEATDEPDGFAAAPEFEITDEYSGGAVRYLEHGYPSPLVRWHHHNAYELHYICASSGKFFVGDHIGEFRAGQVVLTGPRLPHNWITSDGRYPLRDMLVHFDHATIAGAADHVPELAELLPLLARARRGIEFHGMGAQAERYMRAMRDAPGPSRFGLLCQFLHELSQCPDYEVLSTMQLESRTDEAGLATVDRVVNFVIEHYHERLTLARVAEVAGMNESYFSRFFSRSTGNTFSEFLARIRISKACELLTTTDRQITAICYEVGYNNVANFNRRFRERKRTTPRAYRREARNRMIRGGTVD